MTSSKKIVSFMLLACMVLEPLPPVFVSQALADPLVIDSDKEKLVPGQSAQDMIAAQKAAENLIENKNNIEEAGKTGVAGDESNKKTVPAAGDPAVQPGDLNRDGSINHEDYMLWLASKNSSRGDSNYIPEYDLNSDGRIDIKDYAIIVKAFYAQVGIPDREVGDVTGEGNVNDADADALSVILGSQYGDPSFNAAADLNLDGIINKDDQEILTEVLNDHHLLPGDFNGKWRIDAEDYNLWRQASGSHPGDPFFNPAFDLNADGSIDLGDFLLMAQSYYRQEGFEGQPVGDLNNDGRFQMDDLLFWGEHQASHRGEPRYVAVADLNFDGVIDERDRIILMEVLKRNGYVHGDLDGNRTIDFHDLYSGPGTAIGILRPFFRLEF